MLAQQHEAIGLEERVDFVFDDEAEKKDTLKYWELIKINPATQFSKVDGGRSCLQGRQDYTAAPSSGFVYLVDIEMGT